MADDGGQVDPNARPQEGERTSAQASEEARKLLAARKEQLEAAQEREKQAAQTAIAQQAEAERARQMQMAQQQQAAAAAADAAAAAETLRQTREAVAQAEVAEARRLEQEKRALLENMAPEERRRAEELHAQQGAIAAAGFGTAQAAHGAGIVQQGQVLQVAQEAAARGLEADADSLMAMSPEELAEWNRGAQCSNMEQGGVPW